MPTLKQFLQEFQRSVGLVQGKGKRTVNITLHSNNLKSNFKQWVCCRCFSKNRFSLAKFAERFCIQKLADERCRVKSPVVFVYLAVRSFSLFSPKYGLCSFRKTPPPWTVFLPQARVPMWAIGLNPTSQSNTIRKICWWFLKNYMN